MLYLVAFISAFVVALCGWQLFRERQRRIDRSKPITPRPRRESRETVVPGDGFEPPTP